MVGSARFRNETSGLPGIIAQSPFRTDIYLSCRVLEQCGHAIVADAGVFISVVPVVGGLPVV